MKRKIAAILAADAVGYSRLVAEDEEDTLARLASYRGVFGDFVNRFGGRVFNTAGDAILAEFESAVDAVRCAVDIQESLRARNLAYPPSRQMSFRIGITIGDIVERDGDLLGDGVNVAARLESVAPDGGICISRSVYEVVANKVSLEFSDRGQQHLKNIPDPVHAYTFAPDVSSKNRKQASHLASLATRYWGVFAVVMVVLAGIAGFMFIGREQSVQSVKPPPARATKASIPEASEPSVKSADSSSPPAEGTPASPPAARAPQASTVSPEGTTSNGASRDIAESAAGDEPKTPKNVDVGCKKFFPAIGKTLTVPCGVDAQPDAPLEKEALLQPKPELDSHPFIGRWSTSATACDRSAAGIPSGDRVVLFGAANTAQYQAKKYGGYTCRLAKIVESSSGFNYAASCVSGAYLHERHDQKEGHLELDAMGERLTGLGPDGRKLSLVSCDALAETPPAAPVPQASTVSPDGATSNGASRDTAESPAKETESSGERLTLTARLGKQTIEGQARTVIGINIADPVGWRRSCFNVKEAKGALVIGLMPDGPAQDSGLQPGDVIQKLDGKAIVSAGRLRKLVTAEPAGVSVKLDVLRSRTLKENIQELNERAGANDGAAMACLGYVHGDGFGVEKDLAEANRWYRKAAEAGQAEAMNNLGINLENGNGITKDVGEANRWYRKAAEAGFPLAMTYLGVNLENGNGITKDVGEANRWYRKAAEAGLPLAMTYLGVMYHEGRGVEKDEAQAVRWYRKAADKGHGQAMHNLGWRYAYGTGVAKDDAEAVRWYRKAVDKGHAGAMNGLGWLYAHGRGVAKDEAQAVRWYRKAADKGEAIAMTNLGNMYDEGRGVAKDEAQAVRWYRKAADKGEVTAMNNLGNMYDQGRGVAKDEADAAYWYRNAAEKGEASAMTNLGLMYANGRGVAKDEAQAVRWFRTAADKGEATAMHNLGAMYDWGMGVGKDPRQAAEWVFKAVKAGSDFSIKQMNENASGYTKQFRREFQRLLRDAGVYDGRIDGSFGPGVRRAITALHAAGKRQD